MWCKNVRAPREIAYARIQYEIDACRRARGHESIRFKDLAFGKVIAEVLQYCLVIITALCCLTGESRGAKKWSSTTTNDIEELCDRGVNPAFAISGKGVRRYEHPCMS